MRAQSSPPRSGRHPPGSRPSTGLCAVAATLLLGCGSGGSGASAAPVGAGPAVTAPTPSADATVIDCTPGAAHATPLGTMLNNQWNAASAGRGAWRQCLNSRRRADGGTDYGWSWQWPARDGLYAYPELLVGSSPWSDAPSNDARFPRTVADTHRLQVDYDTASDFDGKNNLALEFWLSDLSQPHNASGRSPVKTELMVWSDASHGLVPIGDVPVATVEIDGAAYTVHLQRHWGDASAGPPESADDAGPHWTYIAYQAVRHARAAHYDARKFIDDAMARGLIAPSDSIAGVELGNELVSGSGTSWVRAYRLGVE